MDGFEAAIMIRKLESTNKKPIPILAITACNESDRLKCLEVGINEVIEKPYIPDDLLKKIQSYLPKHKQVLFS
jgi:CheY-like chemotaxis protein